MANPGTTFATAKNPPPISKVNTPAVKNPDGRNQWKTSSSNNTSISFNKGSNTNTPKYYTGGSAVRVYGGGYFIISAPGKKITKIVITFGGDDGSNAITVDCGTVWR